MVSAAEAPSNLAARVAEIPWYHTFDLPGGVTTKGIFDHRQFVKRLPLPCSLAGLRCLDVCASDGFFGFEMARRGAAEVVSLDLPDPYEQDFSGPPRDRDLDVGQGRANRAFDMVKRATGLDVERVDGSIYEIDKLSLGKFDVVFLGNILLHLRDPIGALQALRSSVGGELYSLEPISLPQTILRPFTPTGQFSLKDENTFWITNSVGHRRLVGAGGYEVTATTRPMLQPMGEFLPAWPTRSNLPRNFHEVVYWGFTRRFGQMAACVRARPTR